MATRRERVVLDLEDNYTAGVIRAAAATKLLDGSLDRLSVSAVRSGRSLDVPADGAAKVETNSRRSGAEIDKLSGRLRLLTDVALILGPALAPLGAAAVGGIVAMSAQLGSLAGALGVTILAVNGLGDGLKALDKYQLEPTTENLAKLHEELDKLGPAGEDFVRFLDSIEPNLKTLQAAAREGLLPGAQEGIEALLQRLPELRKLIRGMATEMGDLSSDAGAALGGERFDAFFKYLRTDGIQILSDTSRTIGNLAEATANLFVAFGGISTDFSGGLLDFSKGLAEASSNLEANAGFQEFVQYIETEGPHALETLGSLGNAMLQIVEATAPLGGPVLTIVGTFADTVAMIADSDIGTPLFAGAAALALLNRSMTVTASLQAATFGGPAVAKIKGYVAGLGEVTTAQQRAQMSATQLDAANARTSRNFGKFALPAAGLALSMSGVAESTGLSNTAMLSMVGPWGTAAGLALDLWHATDGLDDAMASMDTARASGNIDAFAASIENARSELEKASDNTILGTRMFGDTLGGISNAIAPLSNVTHTMAGLTGAGNEMADAIAENEEHLLAMSEAEERVAAGATAAIGPLRFMRVASQENAEAAAEQATAMNAAVEAMRGMREEALRSANAELDYQQSIDDANKALKENGKTVDQTTDKGRNNLRALYNLAGAWNGQSEVIKDNAGALRAARENFVETATSMGMAEGAARRLSRELFEIPTKRQIDITLDSGQATAALRALKARLDSIKSKTVQVNVVSNVRPQGGPQPVDEAVKDPRRQPRSGRGSDPLDKMTDPLGLVTSRGAASAAAKAELYGLAAHARDASNGLRALNAQLRMAEKRLEKAKAARDEAIARRDAVSSGIVQGLTTDIWEAPEGGTATPQTALAALQMQKARAQRLVVAIKTLKAKGITGPFLAEIIGTGDVERAEMMATLDIGTLGTFTATFNETQSALAAAALAGGNAAFGDDVKTTTKELRDIQKEVKGLREDLKAADKNNQKGHDRNADRVTAGVNGAASSGHRRGYNNGGRR